MRARTHTLLKRNRVSIKSLVSQGSTVMYSLEITVFSWSSYRDVYIKLCHIPALLQIHNLIQGITLFRNTCVPVMNSSSLFHFYRVAKK